MTNSDLNSNKITFLEEKVKEYFIEIASDILKDRPNNILKYISEWCLEKINYDDINKNTKPSTNDLPHSEDEDDKDIMDENSDEMKKFNNRVSVVKNRIAISGEVFNANSAKNFIAPFYDKTIDQNNRIENSLKKNFIFNSLNEDQQKVIIGAMLIKKVNSNDVVIKEGDEGSELFIVGTGLLKCYKNIPDKNEPTFLRDYNPGDLFGELALMYNAPRAATIIANEESELFSLDRETFNNIVKAAVVNQRERHENFLRRIEFLNDLSEGDRAKICDCLITERLKKGDVIIKENDLGDKFYLIESGTAEAYKFDSNGKEIVVYEYKENDYFGELALLGNDPRQASVRVTSDKFIVASMDRDAFNRLLGSVKSRLYKNISKYQKYLDK